MVVVMESLSRTKSPTMKPKLSFAASDEFFLAFGAADHVGNPLEARQPGFALYSVQIGDLVEDVRGDDGRADELFSVEPALFAPALQEVGDEYGVGLVAVEQFELSVQIAHRDADAIGVRSVPTTMSAFSRMARSVAIFKASGFSGLGDWTVGKSPEGTICSLTVT